MAYGGKSYLSSLENFPILKDYTRGRNDCASKSVEFKHTGIDLNESKTTPLKDNKSKRGFNSGTPCTSVAFTPTGKPSAIRTVKDYKTVSTTKYRGSTPGIFANVSKPSSSKDTTSKKEYNSGTPCISTAFTPSGKPPAIRTVKQNNLNLGKINNESESPSLKGTPSDTKLQSTAKYYISSERSPVSSTVNPKNFILNKANNESKPSSFKGTTSDRKRESTTKYHVSSERSPVINIVNRKDFIPSKANNESRPPSFENTTLDRKHESTTQYHNSSQRSPVISTVNSKDFIPSKANKESKPLSFESIKLDSKHESATKKRISSERSSVVGTVNTKDFILSKANNESRPPSFENPMLDRKYEITTKYHSSLERSPVVSTVNPKNIIPSKTTNDSKPLPLKNTTSVTVHENMTKYYTPLKKSSSVSSVNAMVLPRNVVHNSKLSSLKTSSSDTINQNVTKFYSPLKKTSPVSTEKLKRESVRKETLGSTYENSNPLRFPNTTSKTVRQRIFNKYHSSFRKSYPSENLPDNIRGFDFGSRSFQDPGSSHVPPDAHRGSISVDLLRCILCIDKERDTVFQPCGHLIVCNNCAKEVGSTCPMCRKRIKKKIKAYIT